MKRQQHIIIILLSYCVFSVDAQDLSHLDQSIRIKAQDYSITQLLELVSEQCACYFSYPADLFSEDEIHIKNDFEGSLSEFIHQYLGETISYSTYKNQVILHEEDVSPNDDKPSPSLFISAEVVDSSTMKSIPYASVLIEETMLGTSANGEGQFRLKLDTAFSKFRIQISCLGYYSRSFSVAELQTTDKILLSPANYSLQEVIVRSVESQYVIDKAVENLGKHYRNEAYNYSAFYREIVYRNSTQLSYAEALFQAYSPTNKGMRQDDLVLKKARRFKPAPTRQDSILIKLKGGTEAALKLDIAHYPTDFLSEERHELYHFQVVDIQTWKNQLIYVLSFRPKSASAKGQFEGELYISFENYILLGADFKYTDQELDKLRKSLIIKKTRHTKVVPKHYQYYVEYQEYKGLYHLHHIRGDIVIKAKRKSSWYYKDFRTIFEMILTDMELSDEKRQKSTPRYKTNSVFSEAVAFSPIEFWHYDNVIIPEQKIMDAFYESGFTIEEEK